jgi:outer membrane protein OmpA-like peptidoglycan-associated protein
MRIRNLIVFSLSLLLMSGMVQAQSGALSRGNRYYEQMAYPAAIRAYLVAWKTSQTSGVMERLADSYRQIGDTRNAEIWYGKLANLSDTRPINKFRYGQMLQANGKYAEAQRAFEDYQRTGENVAKATRYAMACARVSEFKADSARYTLTKMKVNSRASDFGAMPWDKGIIFSSARARGFFSRARNMRNEGLFYDLYYADNALPNQEKVPVKPVRGKVNSRFHDGPAVVTREGIMYFTRSNDGKDSKGVVRLKIYSAKWNGKKWMEVKALPFNSNEYSCGHPALSADGNTLIFTSDMPGGKGGTDLWKVTKEGESWGTPQNLGDAINTDGDEKFPYLHSSGTLFFSSDGHVGLGGLDIFSATANGSGQFDAPRNAGFPLNSSRDDFSIAWIGSQANGYITSNRPGGEGDDDLWMFSRKSAIHGTVVDARTQLPLPSATVTVMDANSKTSTYTADSKGEFSHIADFNRDYFVTVEAPGYAPRKEIASTKDMSPVADLQVKLALEPELRYAVSGLVLDDSTSAPLAGATVRLVGLNGEKSVTTDAQGRYKADLDENENYFLLVMKEGYVPHIAQVVTQGTEPQEFVQNARVRRGHYILVNGLVSNQTTQSRLGGATIRGIDAQKRVETAFFRTGDDGRYYMVLDPAIPQFLLVGSRKDFFSRRVDLETPVAQRDTALTADLALVPYRVGEVVKIIYYDYNKSVIREDAGRDLFDIIYFLADNPEAAVELTSHTDCRGNGEYNRDLSQDRADAAVKFITSHGIGSERIKAVGMGESKPVNACVDGTQCDDAQHAENRRTEITVVSLSGSTGVKEAPKTGEESKQ